MRRLVSKFFYHGDIWRLKNTGAQMRSYLGGFQHLPPPLSIQMGVGHSVCLIHNNQIFAWGSGLFGELGNGNTENQSIPVQVLGLPEGVPIKQLCVGTLHNACVLKDNRVYSWGSNLYGQLGNGNKINQSTAVEVIGLPEGVPVRQLCLGFNNSACIIGG